MGRHNTASHHLHPFVQNVRTALKHHSSEITMLLLWCAVAFIGRCLSEGAWWLTLSFGILQWFAMSGYLHGLRLWAMASTLGWATDFGIRQLISIITDQILDDFPNWLPFWLAYGSWMPDGGGFSEQNLWDSALSDGLQWTLIGLFQWNFVLRQFYKSSVLWVFASALGGCLQGILSTLLGGTWGSIVALGPGTIGYGIVTGSALIYLKQANYNVNRPKGRWVIEKTKCPVLEK